MSCLTPKTVIVEQVPRPAPYGYYNYTPRPYVYIYGKRHRKKIKSPYRRGMRPKKGIKNGRGQRMERKRVPNKRSPKKRSRRTSGPRRK